MIEAIDSYYRRAQRQRSTAAPTSSRRRSTDALRGRARARRRVHAGATTETTIFTRNATEAINLVAYAWGRDNVGPGDVVLITHDGAPLQHRARGSCSASETGAKLDYVDVTDDGLLRSTISTRSSPPARQARSRRAHLERARHDQRPVAEIAGSAHAAGAVIADRRLAGDAAAAGRLRRDRRDFYAWTGHKALRPDRDRRAARPPRDARVDGPVARRRRHDRRRQLRHLDLERPAVEVRGRHRADRRSRRARRRDRLHRRRSAWTRCAPTSAT